MVYVLQFGVEQIRGQLILSILIYSHDEPNLGRCHIEYSFGIEDSNFLSIQGKCRAYQGRDKKKRGRTGKKGIQTRSRVLTSLKKPSAWRRGEAMGCWRGLNDFIITV